MSADEFDSVLEEKPCHFELEGLTSFIIVEAEEYLFVVFGQVDDEGVERFAEVAAHRRDDLPTFLSERSPITSALNDDEGVIFRVVVFFVEL